MEISYRQAGAAMPGQSLVAGGRTDGSAAAAFASVLESRPTEATPWEEETPVDRAEDTDEQDDPSDIPPVACLPPDGAPMAARSDLSPPSCVGTTEIADGAAHQASTLTGGKLHRSEPMLKETCPEATDLPLVKGADTSNDDGAYDPPDIPIDPRVVSGGREDMRDPGQSRPIRVAAVQSRAPEAADLIMGREDIRHGNVKSDDPQPALVFETVDQTTFAISIQDRSPATAPDLHIRAVPRPPTGEAQQVLRQVGEKLVDRQEGMIEIVLSPEELGKVRVMIASGEKPAVVIFAERPETYDLLRRNADSLDKELQSAGIFGADISFTDGNENRNARDHTPAGGENIAWYGEENTSLTDKTNPAQRGLTADRRIDIRI